jgi:hypothetical protein
MHDRGGEDACAVLQCQGLARLGLEAGDKPKAHAPPAG